MQSITRPILWAVIFGALNLLAQDSASSPQELAADPTFAPDTDVPVSNDLAFGDVHTQFRLTSISRADAELETPGAQETTALQNRPELTAWLTPASTASARQSQVSSHGGPLWKPLCYAQIGGLAVATFIALLLVPVFYSIAALDLRIVKWETARRDVGPGGS